MNRGGKRIGAGRKPKTLAEHKRDGTFRHSRHQHLLTLVPARVDGASAPALAPTVSPIPDYLTENLGPTGLRYLTDRWSRFEHTGAEEILLRQAARAADEAERDPSPSVRRMAARLFVALDAQLRAREA